MKKSILLLCLAAGLLSCAKLEDTPQEEKTQPAGRPMTFKVNVAETKAAKTDWADGDKIYVFFYGMQDKYLILERSGDEWVDMSFGNTLFDTDFADLPARRLTAVYFPVEVDITYANNTFSFTREGKPVYDHYYLFDSGKSYIVYDTTVSFDLDLIKPAGLVNIHIAGIQDNMADYTFGCSKIQPIACAGVGVDGSIKESSLQAGTRISGVADSNGGIFIGRLTKDGQAANYAFVVAGNDKIYTLTRENKALSSGKTYKFPALSVTGGTNWAVTNPEDLYVDMGITVGGKTIYWAKCNLGATSETDCGDLFAWGELTGYNEGKTHFDGSSASGSHPEKYRYNEDNPDDPENLATLLPEDDAAYAALGGKFRIPTDEEWQALVNTKSDTENYTWTWYDNGPTVRGLQIVRKSTSATLFIPAVGCRSYQWVGRYDVREDVPDYESCFYWSSSLFTEFQEFARYFSVIREDVEGTPVLFIDVAQYYRWYGFSVRPVSE